MKKLDSFCYYPHMSIGKVWIYRLLFVFVCFKASGVTFCTLVHGRPGQGISHFGALRSPFRWWQP